jgi:hypothetical protein
MGREGRGMKSNQHSARPGVAEARRLLKARKGPPTDADRPQRLSKPPRVLPGQIDIFGHVHGRPPSEAS